MKKIVDNLLFGEPSLWIRFAIISGVVLRLIFTYPSYESQTLVIWLAIIVIYTVFSMLVTYYSVLAENRHLPQSFYLVQIIFDTMIISTFYLLTQWPDSDIFLFYFLPLIILADHFKGLRIVLIFLLISILFLAVVLITSHLASNQLSLIESLVRNVLPRWSFFLFMVFLAFMRGNNHKKQANELAAVRETALKISSTDSVTERLDSIMKAATNLLRARGCKVYLKVDGTDEIKLEAITGMDDKKINGGYTLKYGEGFAGHVIKKGTGDFLNDYSNSDFAHPPLKDLFEAIVAVPMCFGNEAIGVLAVFDNIKQRKFAKADVVILERLAQHAAVAIHDAQLVQQVRRQSLAWKQLIDAGNALNDSLELTDTLNAVVRHAWELSTIYSSSDPIFTCFLLTGQNDNELEFKAAFRDTELENLQSKIAKIDLNKSPRGVVGRVALSKQAELVPDVKSDPDYLKYSSKTKMLVAVPVVRGEKLLGVIDIEHAENYPFSKELLENSRILATQAAAAIENSLFHLQLLERRRRAEILNEASLALSSVNNISDVGREIVNHLQKMIPVERATVQRIWSYNSPREIIFAYRLNSNEIDDYLLRPVKDDPLILDILKGQCTAIVPNPTLNSHWKPRKTTQKIKCWICIPLFYQQRAIGLITVDQLSKDEYTGSSADFLDLFAGYAASSLQNAILLEDNLTKINDLSEAHDKLEAIIEHVDKIGNLALIGLVYGESIHHARSKLGLAKALALDIATNTGYGTTVPEQAQQDARIIIKYINDYLDIIAETQREAIQSPVGILINLNQTLDSIVQSKLKSRFEGQIIDYKTNYSGPHLIKAPSQLRQVFFVIIQNALAAMPFGGRLYIETVSETLDERSYVKVLISDTGPGIPDEKVANLFLIRDRGSKHRYSKSSGLGLPWSRSFLRAYGGDIDFKTSSEGTTIIVVVPTDFGEPPLLSRL